MNENDKIQINNEIKEYDRIIIGIDPGTNVMGYGILGEKNKKPRLIAMGVIKLNKMDDHYMRLHHIYQRVTGLVEAYLPDEMAIEAPFYGKNVQSMLKLGRAQGVAMAAALNREIPITEYEPRRIKQAITGTGAASKEQVAEILKRTLDIASEEMPEFLDATDALAAALCHYYSTSSVLASLQGARRSVTLPVAPRGGRRTWEDFVHANPDRVKKG